MLSAQSQNQNQNSSTTNNATPGFDSEECCDLPNAGLDIGFYRTTSTWEDCSVVAGGATVFYPTDGSSGSVEVCVNLPRTTEGYGNFEIYDLGDFNTATVVSNGGEGTYNQICQTVNYPEFNADGDIIGHKLLTFYVVPVENTDEFIISRVRGINGSLSSNGQTCNCDGVDNQSLLYTGRLSDVFATYYDSSTPVNLSDVVAAPIGQSGKKFQDPSVSGSSTVEILFKGTLNVDIDYDLGNPSNAIFSTLTLGPDAKINILPGKTLTIRNTEVSGCRTMWDAFTVQDGGELVLEDSRIKQGKNAITVLDGGTLLSTATEFSNNKVSIYTPPAPNNSMSRVDIGVFGSTFDFKTSDGLYSTDDDFLPAPYLLEPHFGEIPDAAGVFENVRTGIVFADIPPAGNNLGERFNRFRNMANGLIFDNSSASVSGSRFSDMVSQSTVTTGNGIYLTGADGQFHTLTQVRIVSDNAAGGLVSFERMNTGVRLNNGGNVRVYDTEMYDVVNGLYSSSGKRIYFRRNYIESSQNGFYRVLDDLVGQSILTDNTFIAGGNLQGSLGIGMVNVGNNGLGRHRLIDNAITIAGAEYGIFGIGLKNFQSRYSTIDWTGNMFGTKGMSFEGGSRPTIFGSLITGTAGQPFTETSGMEFFGVDRPYVICNNIDDVETGMFFFGNNQGGLIRGNLFQDAGVGLQLGIDLPFIDDATIIGEQFHHGNRWTGAYQGFGAAFFNSSSLDRSNSAFTVNTSQNPSFAPPSINPSAQNDWFFNSSLATTVAYACPDGLPPTSNLNSIGRKLTRFLYSPPGTWTATIRDASYRLYRAEAMGEINSSIFGNWNNWISHPTNSSIPDFYAYEEVSSNLAGLNDSRLEAIDTLFGSVSSVQDAFASETVRYYFDSTVNANASAALRVSLLDSIETLELSTILLRDSLAAEYQTNVQTAAALAAALPTSTLVESNLAEIDDFTHLIQTVGLTALKNHQSTIVSIAEQCPLDGGEAVYQARAMAFALGASLVIDDLQNCSGGAGGGPGKMVERGPNQVKLFPVPASQELNFSAGEIEIRSITIRDLNGRTIRHKTFGKNGTVNGSFSTDDMAAGVYTVEIQLADGTTEKQLAIIQ